MFIQAPNHTIYVSVFYFISWPYRYRREQGIIRVRRQVARIHGKIIEAPLKTKNSYRAISISQDAVEVLKIQKAKIDDRYVFPSPNGGPISPDSVTNMLHRVLERAGLPKVRSRDLRHTFATLAL